MPNAAAVPWNGPPVVLSIAGSDNSAGAGIQADIKAFTEAGCYGLTAITCVVAEVPGRVYDLQSVRPALLAEQIRTCFEAFPVGAVKTGMLYSNALLRVVVEELQQARQRYRRQHRAPFAIVVDPVMVASSGDALLKPNAVKTYRERLFPMASVITPNVDELAVLIGRRVDDEGGMREAGEQLMTEYGVPFLCKGGHLGGEEAVDWLIDSQGRMRLTDPFVPGAETHGTGCTYSAGIAARLARGQDLRAAVRGAKRMITRAIREAHVWGTTRALAVPVLKKSLRD